MDSHWLTTTCRNVSGIYVVNVSTPRHVVHDDVIKWKHFPRYWPFVRGIHRSPVNSPHKGQWRGALVCSLICAWINGWVNNREAADLRRHRTHYNVTAMRCCWLPLLLQLVTCCWCYLLLLLLCFIPMSYRVNSQGQHDFPTDSESSLEVTRQTSNISRTKYQNLNVSRLVLYSCLCSIHWSQTLSREWRCSWSSADRQCSNYIWVINNFIAY